MFDIVLAMRVAVIAVDKVFDLGLAAVLDAFQTANELAQMAHREERFDVRVIGVRKNVTTSQGLRVPIDTARRWSPDCVVVPAIGFKMPDALLRALERPDVRDCGDLLRQWNDSARLMCAACIGTFVMAESGLLADQRATTTWWLAPMFRERYPATVLDDSSMIVKSEHYVTAGAALGHMDLALWIIRRHSPQLAALTARYLIVDSRPAQSAYALTDHLIHSDSVVQRFEAWARTHLREGFSLDRASRAAGASKRTLARRLESVLGMSPLAYFQKLRIERAVHLLKTTDTGVDQIAERVGYADAGTLRTLLKKHLNLGVRDLRR
jgi:transcriptional regulator GlxA family with amidase domain